MSTKSPGMPRFEIGVDIGGTFTDIVCRDPGVGIRLIKVPSTRRNPSQAVIRSLAVMQEKWGLAAADIARFVHGTTVATNAVLERKGARIGLIATAGFRDVLEIGRQMRSDVYRTVLEPETPVFLAPGRFRVDVRERVSAQGEVVLPLNEKDLVSAADYLVAEGAEAIAVCFLFSFLNPAHELRARALIAERHPNILVSLSHEVDPAFREYERTVATAFDAYVKPVVDHYIDEMEAELSKAGVKAPLQVMQSRGGLTAAQIARQRPVRLFLSGPAAGVIGGRIAGASSGHENLITIDIGGTSADIALISRRKPMIRTEGLIGRYPIRTAMVDVNTIGSGGGSIARVDASGALRVGPESAGSEPGPACYDRGATEPTVTDASVVLGYLDPNYFAGGSFRLRADLAHAAVEKIAGPLGLSTMDAALGIHRVLNASMAEGIRLVSVRQGVDPRSYALVPLGGAGGIHATALARNLGMTRVLVPRIPGVLAAAGLLAASIEHEVATSFITPIEALDATLLRSAIATIDARAAELMLAEKVDPDEVTILYLADVCYIGQSYSLEVPFDPNARDVGRQLYKDFLVAHERIYGHAVEGPAKIVNIRTVHQARGQDVLDEMRLPVSGRPAEVGRRMIRVPGHEAPVEAIVYERDALAPGTTFSGPAIIQQPDTTTIADIGWSGTVDDVGNIILTYGGAGAGP